MPVRPIVVYPDPRLREEALDVLVPSSIQVVSLVEDLIETMFVDYVSHVKRQMIGKKLRRGR